MKGFQGFSKFFMTAVSVLSAACLFLTVMLVINGAKPNLFVRDAEQTDNAASNARLEQTFDYGDSYIDSIVFVGDCTMSFIPSSDAWTYNSVIWSGADGHLSLDYNTATAELAYTADGKKATASEAAALLKPQYMLITLGYENGVSHCSEASFKEYYRKLVVSVQEASPSTGIILQSVFPISKKADKSSPSISNEKIDIANRWIEELACELSVRYLDTASALKDSDGRLTSAYDSGDGVSINADGIGAVINYIKTHGYR